MQLFKYILCNIVQLFKYKIPKRSTDVHDVFWTETSIPKEPHSFSAGTTGPSWRLLKRSPITLNSRESVECSHASPDNRTSPQQVRSSQRVDTLGHSHRRCLAVKSVCPRWNCRRPRDRCKESGARSVVKTTWWKTRTPRKGGVSNYGSLEVKGCPGNGIACLLMSVFFLV